MTAENIGLQAALYVRDVSGVFFVSPMLYPFCRNALKQIPDCDHLGGFLGLPLRHWIDTFGEKLSGVAMSVPRICERNVWVLSQ
jgi:hypothetical protein